MKSLGFIPMKFFLLFLLFFTLNKILSQDLYFPPVNNSYWEKFSFTELGWDSTKLDTLYQFLFSKNTKAFLLLKEGKIVIEKYFDSFTVDSLWYWASAGKTITAFLIGLAQQEGYLSIENSTSKYLGKWTFEPEEKEALIKIKHQLSMTTGLDDRVADPYCTLPSCLLYLADAGTRWAYHNAPYTLLDSVLHKATGQNLNQYFWSRIRTKTGITGLFIKSDYNNLFVSTPRSMARFGLLILNRGKWSDEVLMSDDNYFNQMVNTSQNINESYGYLWWLNGKKSFMVPGSQFVFPGPLFRNAPLDMISALGKNGQFLNVVPSLRLVVVRMGNAPDSTEAPIQFNNAIWELLNPIIKNISGMENTKYNPNEKTILLGNYPNPFNPTTTIRFSLPRREHVTLKVFDVLGREVATLVNGEVSPGEHSVVFDAKDLPSGVYFAQLRAGNIVQRIKMILMK